MAHADALRTPALCIALALSIGLIAQAIARHLRIPGIIVLLAVGVLLGPDVAGVIRPEVLGNALPTLVGFAVAVILFEGGLSLDFRRMRRESRAIRQLVTLGAVVSVAGGVALARWGMGWGLRPSVLFGTLVMVTGPTVINPLMRRLRVEQTTSTILEAEGMLLDGLGAIVATVALEIVLEPSGGRVALGALQIVMRLGTSVVFGAVFGVVMVLVLRTKELVPEGLENVLTLSLVLALFQTSNAVSPESGIGAVIVAGTVIGNANTRIGRELAEFKEQLTVMLIGMLFVLLAADVRLADVRALGRPAVVTVAALILLVRPACVALGTWGTDLGWRRRAFIGWIGPRGVVAAAVASFFATQLERHQIEGGRPLRALVFLVIAVTVTVAGATGGFLAGLLGLARKSDNGWVLLGANELALALARALRDGGDEVLCIDTNPQACRAAEQAGVRAIFGNALSDGVLQRAELDTRAGAVAVTPNDELNLLFVRRAKRERKAARAYAAIAADEGAAATAELDLLRATGGQLLFAKPIGVEAWSVRLRHDAAAPQRWRARAEAAKSSEGLEQFPDRLVLPLVVRRGGRASPASLDTRVAEGDELDVVVDTARAAEAAAWLEEHGWERVTPAAGASAA